jgi:hypothetical protein
MHATLVYRCNKQGSNVILSIQFDTNVSQLLGRVLPWSYDPLPSLGELSASSLNRLSKSLPLSLRKGFFHMPLPTYKNQVSSSHVNLFPNTEGAVVLGGRVRKGSTKRQVIWYNRWSQGHIGQHLQYTRSPRSPGLRTSTSTPLSLKTATACQRPCPSGR